MFIIKRLKFQTAIFSRISNFKFAGDNDTYKKREAAQEKQFFTVEEGKYKVLNLEKILRKLVDKMSKNVPLSTEEKEELKGKDEGMLKIFEDKHKVVFTKELFHDILLWKKGEL